SGDTIGSMAVSPDSRTLVFTTSGVEGGRPVQSIWSQSLDSSDPPRRLTQAARPTEEDGGPPPFFGGRGGLGSLQFTKDGRTLYYRQGTGLYALTLRGASPPARGRATPSADAPAPRGPPAP